MQTIRLHSVVPEIFAERSDLKSEVWGQDVVFERGKSYLIEAESGGGKSSLCSYLYGRRGDYRGTILFDNEDISKLSIEAWSKLRERNISTLFQDLRLFGELSAMENVELKNNLTNHLSRTSIEQMFEELAIADKMHTPISLLSFGQQQRVALIRALAQPIDFLLLDEPVSHLDERNSLTMRNIIVREAQRQGCAIIATSIGKELKLNYDKHLKL